MDYIVLDKGKCTGCSLCVEECPNGVLAVENRKALIAHTRLCISCGHCAAICPEDAIESHPENRIKPFSFRRLDPGMPPEQLLFIKKRSIRNFKDTALKKEQIHKLIEYGERAPSSHNFRNRKYYVITDEKNIKEIKDGIVKVYKKLARLLNPLLLGVISLFNKKACGELSELVLSFKKLIEEHKKGKDKIFRGSRCIICIAAPKGSTQSKDDCVAAQHYMMLYGKTINLDSFIVGYAQHAHKVIEKALQVKKGFEIFAVSAFGVGKNEYKKEIRYKKIDIAWN